jgi:hypothetical protein
VAVGLQSALDRVANVSGDIFEVRQSLGIARHAVAVILDREIVCAAFSTARNRDGLGMRVDAVLHELGDRLERIALR